MTQSKKTKQEIIAELEAVRSELESLKVSQESPRQNPPSRSEGGYTRREAVAVWVAPVVLSIPLVARSAGAQGRSGEKIEGGTFPTQAPIMFTASPTQAPVMPPSMSPTHIPTQNPTYRPTQNPTYKPTQNPTHIPTQNPTHIPTQNPTYRPTQNPTYKPTQNPTQAPIMSPTVAPTAAPVPTSFPTSAPTTTEIFSNGFETGDASQWSGTVSKASKGGARTQKKSRPRGRELVESGFPSSSKDTDDDQ